MPMKPDSVIWSSLLGFCRKHGETLLAKLAADKFKELEPNNSLGYVQMSNVYSSAGSFTEACLITKLVVQSNIVGCIHLRGIKLLIIIIIFVVYLFNI